VKESAFQQLDRVLDDLCAREQYSGVLRLTLRDRVIFEKYMGYADRENKIPFTNDSVFNLYSMTKPFCAIGFMKLVEQGLVDLDRHPGAYLPEARGFDSRVTLRQILQHVGGLPDFEQDTDMEKRYPGHTGAQQRACIEELAANYPQHFAPGTGDHYANINYILPALIIEELTGRAFPEYMKNEVFEPLGAHTAQIANMDTVVEHRVKGYGLRDGDVVYVGHTEDWMYGAGDGIGRADDVYCLNKVVKHRLLLKPESWEQILTPSPLSGKGFGCAVIKWGEKHRIQHNGGHRGFRTLHIHVPEDDFDLILLSNSGWGNARVEITRAVFDACYGTNNQMLSLGEMDKGYV